MDFEGEGGERNWVFEVERRERGEEGESERFRRHFWETLSYCEEDEEEEEEERRGGG